MHVYVCHVMYHSMVAQYNITCTCLSFSPINCRGNQDDVVIIEGRSSPSNVESFVEVSSQPGPSSRCSGGSNRVGVSLTHHSPSVQNYDQPGSLSPTFDDLKSFNLVPAHHIFNLQHRR